MRRISNLSNRGGWAKEAVLAKSTGLELHALIFYFLIYQHGYFFLVGLESMWVGPYQIFITCEAP